MKETGTRQKDAQVLDWFTSENCGLHPFVSAATKALRICTRFAGPVPEKRSTLAECILVSAAHGVCGSLSLRFRLIGSV